MNDSISIKRPKLSRRARRRGGIVRIRGKNGDTFKVKIDLPQIHAGNGKRPTFVRTFKSYEEAERELLRLREQADRGVRIAERMTLADWAKTWLADTIESQVETITFERYSVLLNRHVIPTLGQTEIRKLSTADIEWLYNTLRTSGGLSVGTVTYVHRVLFQCLKDAVRLKKISENPAATVKRPKAKKTAATNGDNAPVAKMKILDRDQLTQLLDGVKSRVSKVLPHSLVLLALDSGARRGELLALRWSDIDLDQRTLRIDRAVDDTKTYGVTIKDAPKNDASRRTVTISKSTVDVLRAERKRQDADAAKLGKSLPGDALVFPRSPMEPTTPIPPRYVTQQFIRTAKALGFPGLRFHDLRHNTASHMLAAGRPVPAVARHLGHSTPAITMRVYAHAIPEKAAGAGLLDTLLPPPSSVG